MKPNPSRQARESSSSNPTVISERSDAVLALGKKLIRDLKLGNTTDTLTRWMVHYLAELMKDAERKSVENRPAILEKCFNTILAIWQHRHELPNGKRPFEGFEPILHALESLDPKNSDRRYFPAARPLTSETDESKATQGWIKLADGLDYSARVLIRQCLVNAAASAIDKSKDWIVLAEQAGLHGDELPVLKIIIGERDMNEAINPADEQRKILVDRVGKLRAFITLANKVAADYDRQISRSKQAGKPSAPRKSGKVPKAPKLARPENVIIVGKPPRKRVTKKTSIVGLNKNSARTK
jgi:hypothetical protein